MTAITPGRAGLLALADRLDKSTWGIKTNTASVDLTSAAAFIRLAAKPADKGVRELKQRIHNLRVTLSSVVTLAESASVSLKTQNAIAKAAKHSLDRDASTTVAPKLDPPDNSLTDLSAMGDVE